MENDQQDLPFRLSLLENRLQEQNDEIVCLRSTLADALRRISALETSRGSSPSKETVPGSRSVQALRTVADSNTSSSSQSSRDLFRNQGSSASTTPVVGHSRNSIMNQSNGSLASDCTSSNSPSPAPSPSPTQYRQQQVQFNSLIGDARNGRNKSTNSSAKASLASASNGFHASKRWSSTSDFIPTNSLISRKPDSISLLNLNMKNSNGNISRVGKRDAIYNSVEGVVKLNIRGQSVDVYVPNDLREQYTTSPSQILPKWKLKMDWVYGYRGKDCRSNLFIIPTGEIAYFVASVVVLFNVEEHRQRFYLGHTGEIKCLAVHPSKLLLASGQAAGRGTNESNPHVRIWNSVSLLTLYVVGLGDFDKSISCIAFSKADGGNLLLIVDEAPDQHLSLWDWQKAEKGMKIIETRCSSDLVVAVEWNPVPKERFAFVTCGKGHLYFWALENGGLTRKLGVFESRDKPKYVTCLVFTDNGDLLSGDSNGSIFVWSKGTNSVYKILRNAHEGPIFSILTLKDGRIVSGGGKDGQLVLWDFPSYRRTGYVTEIPVHYGHVRTIIQGKGTQILVGTTGNCILRGNFEMPFTPLIIGHTEELWSLCVHPSQSQFLSCGYDGRIQLWDTMSRTLVWDKDMGVPLQSASFSPDGLVIILASTCGKWFVMDYLTRDIYSTHVDGNEPIQVVKFSPDGKLLAVGSRDNNIYIYNVLGSYREYSRAGRCVGHLNSVSHMDWASDSVHLQSNSRSNELLYWNARVCRQISQSSSVRDVEWSSSSCPLSFSTLGIWPDGANGVDVTTCCKSNSSLQLVSGDNLGRVKIFTYPTSQLNSQFYSYLGHADVTSVCFLHDDTRVLSAGGRDSSVIQWSVETTV